MKSSPEHIPWLDGWRGIAILLVLLEHFGGIPTGRLGVEVFFVLSGFLISRMLFDLRVPLGSFYRRRAARIFPVFYLYLATMAFAGWIVLPAVDWASIGWSAVFLRSYVGGPIWEDPLALGNLWSLNVEEHAYLLLSLFALVATKHSERAARWLLTLAVLIPPLLLVIRKAFPEASAGTAFELRTECAIFPLLAAATIFLWVRAYRPVVSARAACGLLLASIACAMVDIIGVARGGTFVKHLLLPVLLALCVNVLDSAPTWLRNALSTRWLMWFGTCSYSIYLWHYPFFYLENHGHWPFGRAAGLAAAMVVGCMSFYLFERPLRALLRSAKAPAFQALKASA